MLATSPFRRSFFSLTISACTFVGGSPLPKGWAPLKALSISATLFLVASWIDPATAK